MTIIVKSMDGFDIAHEALMLKEYGEEVILGGLHPRLALVSESSDATIRKYPVARRRTPTSNAALSAAEDDDSFSLLSSTDFPQCP